MMQGSGHKSDKYYGMFFIGFQCGVVCSIKDHHMLIAEYAPRTYLGICTKLQGVQVHDAITGDGIHDWMPSHGLRATDEYRLWEVEAWGTRLEL